MKRDEVKKLLGDAATDEMVDGIMALNGKDLESEKGKLAKLQTDHDALKTQVESLNTQLAEAGKQIEAFKGMDIESVKKSAEEYRLAAEKAKTDAAAQLAALRFDHAVEAGLAGAKARNVKAVRALLDPALLKLNEADGSIVGLNEQIEKLKESSAYLFEGAAPDPKIVAGTNPPPQKTPQDAFLALARKGAGFTEPKK